MSDDPRRLASWALATFHASAFVVAAILILYSRHAVGGLLANLNTLVGLGLFVALWVTTFATTSRALAGLDVLAGFDEAVFARRAFRMGAANGMAFVLVLGTVLAIGSIAATPIERGPQFVLFIAVGLAPIALVVAAAVGAVVGAIFAVVDLVLIAIARAAVAGASA